MLSYLNSDPVFLKVKIKSLAAEQVIIRQEEGKVLDRRRSADLSLDKRQAMTRRHRFLYLHRTRDVRSVIRVNHLAACFLRGTAYWECEKTCAEPPNFREVLKHVRRFGAESEDVLEDAFAEWVWQAIRHLESQGHRRSSIYFEREKEPALKVPA